MTDTVQPALDPATEVQLVRELRERIHVTLAVDQSSSDGRPLPSTAADERRIRAKVMDELATARLVMPQEMRDRIARLVVSVTVGNGPLDELLHRDGVTEIIINGHDEVMIESDKGLKRHAESFLDAVGHDGQTMERWLPIEQDNVPVLQVPLDDVAYV